ncbi:hypothetical protein SAMN04488122_1040 [Chitinophaga arvensicola]|uniref:Uncharacterized protein n=1 Tax=Chitinophaga arvensicola TaxID=29529 RepID=A0A1I0PW75_9BACT|nr:hypothetical protein SAMN04488122_1040 [Chitinophaga arvensicola]
MSKMMRIFKDGCHYGNAKIQRSCIISLNPSVYKGIIYIYPASLVLIVDPEMLQVWLMPFAAL